jgi:hypothetical protein
MAGTYLPVLGLTLQQHGVLGLADVALVAVLDLLGALLSLDAVILGEGTLVASTTGVSKEVRANGLDASLDGAGELADGLEVLFGTPALREDGQGEGIVHSGHGVWSGVLGKIRGLSGIVEGRKDQRHMQAGFE